MNRFKRKNTKYKESIKFFPLSSTLIDEDLLEKQTNNDSKISSLIMASFNGNDLTGLNKVKAKTFNSSNVPLYECNMRQPPKKNINISPYKIEEHHESLNEHQIYRNNGQQFQERMYSREMNGGKNDNNLNIRSHIPLYGKRAYNGGAQFMNHYNGDNTIMFKDNNEYMQQYLMKCNTAYEQEKCVKINDNFHHGYNFNNSNMYMNEKVLNFNELSYLRQNKNNKFNPNLVSSTLCENNEKKISDLVKNFGVGSEDIIDITNECDMEEYRILNEFKKKENSKFENIQYLYEKLLFNKKDNNLKNKEETKENKHDIVISQLGKRYKAESKGANKLDNQAEKDINQYTIKLAHITLSIANNDKKIEYLKEEMSKSLTRKKELERENMELREMIAKVQKEQELYGIENVELSPNECKELKEFDGNFIKIANGLSTRSRTTALCYSIGISPLPIALLKRKISFIIQLYQNELTSALMEKSRCQTVESTLYEIGYKFDIIAGYVDKKECLALCKERLDNIRKIEKELREHELTTCVEHLLTHRNQMNDDTLQFLLDPRRIWPG